LERGLHLAESGFGPDHLSVLSPLLSLCRMDLRAGDGERALPLAVRALRIAEGQPEPVPRAEAPALYALGSSLRLVGRPQQAAACFGRLLIMQAATDRPADQDAFNTLLGLTYASYEASDPSAITHLQRALEVAEGPGLIGIDDVPAIRTTLAAALERAETAGAGTPEAGTPEAGTPEAGTPDTALPDAATPEET
jgi:hypothetical protein